MINIGIEANGVALTCVEHGTLWWWLFVAFTCGALLGAATMAVVAAREIKKRFGTGAP